MSIILRIRCYAYHNYINGKILSNQLGVFNSTSFCFLHFPTLCAKMPSKGGKDLPARGEKVKRRDKEKREREIKKKKKKEREREKTEKPKKRTGKATEGGTD